MKVSYFISILVIVGSLEKINAQVDTLELRSEVAALLSEKDHFEYWNKLYDKDQNYRGVKTSKVNDLENLISVTYYLQIHGYPSEIIKKSRIVPTIWVHNSYPSVAKAAFPIVLHALREDRVTEKGIRIYYVRNMHWRRHFNEDNRTKDLNELFADLGLNVAKSTSVKEIMDAYNKDDQFLKQDWRELGHWENPKGDCTVKILKSQSGEHYVYNLYTDGSHFPEPLVQDEKYSMQFRNIYKLDYYFGIQENGDLSVRDYSGKRTLKPVVK